jgi:spermidine synthase
MVFMGHLDPPKINIDEVQARLDRPDYAPVADSLREIELNSLTDLFANYVGQNADLAPWVAGAAINRDGDLKLQYLAGWGINSDMADVLYKQMMSYRRTPNGLFSGSPEKLQALLQFLSPGSRGRF